MQNIRYGNKMSRNVDPTIKAELLGRILEHFEQAPLSSLRFRKLADSLGVSTYALVYHFGSRDELLAEIVRAIAERQKRAEDDLPEVQDRIDCHIAALTASFAWSLDPENLRLQRLEFEAAMIEALDPAAHTATRTTFAYWLDETETTLIDLGVDPARAAIEARVLNNFFYGFQYDLVVNSDPEAASIAFHTAIPRYAAFLRRIVAETAAVGPNPA